MDLSNQYIDGLKFLVQAFEHKNVKCYELQQVTWQKDLKFINIILNIFWMSSSQRINDIGFLVLLRNSTYRLYIVIFVLHKY